MHWSSQLQQQRKFPWNSIERINHKYVYAELDLQDKQIEILLVFQSIGVILYIGKRSALCKCFYKIGHMMRKKNREKSKNLAADKLLIKTKRHSNTQYDRIQVL